MSRSIIYRVELSQIFPEDSGKTLDDFLTGITREFILKTGSFLISFQKDSSFSEDNKKVIEDWFRPDNRHFAQYVFNKIREIEITKGWKALIINAHATLKLLEAAFNKDEQSILQSEQEMEINLFKAYLLINESDNRKDEGLLKSLSDYDESLKFSLLILTQTLRYADVASFYLKEVFISQFIRGCLMLKFLEANYPPLLSAFLNYFGLGRWTDFFSKYLPLVHLALKNNERKFTEISIVQDRERAMAFIDKVAVKKDDEDLVPFDFITLRANPLFKSTENSYRVVYDLFLVEKMYNGLYFILKAINEQQALGYKVRDIFTFEFSEKEVLYTVLNAIYSKPYKTFSGASLDGMRVKGAPDFYISKGNKILLFESKDVFIDAETKESANYNIYEDAIKKRFYFEQKAGKLKKRAVLQQIEIIRKIISRKLEFDTPVPSKIYPIVVIHNRQLNVAGLNHLVNSWFMDELEKVEKEGLDVRLVRPLTVIDISSLILYMDYLKFGKLSLPELIDEYHQKTDIRKGIQAKNAFEFERKLIQRTLSFAYFLRNKISKPEPPKLYWDLAKEVTNTD